MTNKIIIGLAIAVTVLFVMAYQLWDGVSEPEKATSSTIVERKKSVTIDESSIESIEVTAVEIIRPGEDKPASQINPAPNTQKEKATGEELCQLALKYDDWYHNGKNYESEQLIKEMREWGQARGYFETEYSNGSVGIKKRSDYDYYATKDLEAMADAGDSMANVRLAYRLYLKGDNDSLAKAQPYCDRAIVDGYTALVVCKESNIVKQIYQEKRKQEQDRDAERIKALELEYRSWQRVAKRLGDDLAEKLSLNMLATADNTFEDSEIERNVDSMMANIKQRREELGVLPRTYPEIPKILEYILEEEHGFVDNIDHCLDGKKP